MTREKKRQAVLVGVLVTSLAGYLRFGAGFGAGEAAAGPAEVPVIEVAGLMNAIKDVATINPSLIGVARADSEADRNLFQYGVRKPQPPTPAELEAQRQAAQAALEAQERALREQAEQQRLLEEQRKQAELLAQQNPPPIPEEQRPPQPPPPPPRPEPPTITFKLMGMLGPAERKLGVFLDGDKVLMARQGDVLLGKFKVLAIGPLSADIGYVDPLHKDEKKRLQIGQ